MSETEIAARVRDALALAGVSQRELARRTGISQPTLHRIISGERVATIPELIRIGDATGHSLRELAGAESMEDTVEISARATDSADMDSMRSYLLHCVELNRFLDDCAI